MDNYWSANVTGKAMLEKIVRTGFFPRMLSDQQNYFQIVILIKIQNSILSKIFYGVILKQ